MAIEFNCPHCGKFLTTSDERAAARAKCPACGDLITVPTLQSAGGVGGSFAATAHWSSLPDNAATAQTGSNATGPISEVGSPPPAVPNTAPRMQPDSGVCAFCEARVDPRASYCSTCGGPLFGAAPRFHYAVYWRRVVALVVDVTIISLATEGLEIVLPSHGWFSSNLWLSIWFLYYALCESSPTRATPGKRLVGISVCGSDGRRLSFPRAGVRTVAKIGSFLICGVGFLMPLLTPRKQALHDLLTDAVVIRK